MSEDIEQISSEIDFLLEQERNTHEFAVQKLREYTHQVLQSSYQKTREDLGSGTVGEVVTTGIAILGSLFSQSRIVDAANKVSSDYEKVQRNLDEKWHIAEQKLDSLSSNELFWILYLNRKNGFMSALTFLLSSN